MRILDKVENKCKKKNFFYIRYIFNYVLDKIFIIIIIVRKREQFLQKLFGTFLYRIFYRELLY